VPVPAFTSWLYQQPYGQDNPSTPTVHYGPEPFARDPLDAKRMGLAQTPESMYPDGYLGTIRSRRDDRLLDALKDRQGKRPYQRGVHKGERVDPRDYYWDARAMTPTMGLERQAASIYTGDGYVSPRHVPVMVDGPERLVAEGKMNMRRAPIDSTALAAMRPSWR
jgi:hypothetical protein